ncbi:MAG TPA: hypothetical protein VIB07_02105 [Nitrososphaera sp.]
MVFTFIIVLVLAPLLPFAGLLPMSAYADAATWSRTYGSGPALWAEKTSDGAMVVAGDSHSIGPASGFLVMRLDLDGNVEWAKAGQGFSAQEAHMTADGGYIVLADLPDTPLIFKLDSDGNIEWQKSNTPRIGFFHFIQQTSDNGYVIAGHLLGSPAPAAWVLKLDSDGNIEWDKAYGGGSGEGANALKQTSDGGYIVVGFTSSFGEGNGDFWVLKLDSDGNVQWEKAFGSEGIDDATSVDETADGGYIVGGTSESFGDGSADFWVLKLDSDGNVQWEKAFGGDDFGFLEYIRETSDGGYVAAGFPASAVKLDPDGNIEWTKSYKGDGLHSIDETPDGGYVAAGETHSFGFNANFWLLKLNSDGVIDNCISSDIVEDATATVVETSGGVDDTEAVVQDTSASLANTEFEIKDFEIPPAAQCGPSLDYSLTIFENFDEFSDGTTGLGQDVRAVASTIDASVDQITFRWMDPAAEIVREVTVSIGSPEDTFAPDVPGDWVVEADFGNGQVLRNTLSIPFFVLPESPIGALAMVLASMGSLGAYLYFRSKKTAFTA